MVVKNFIGKNIGQKLENEPKYQWKLRTRVEIYPFETLARKQEKNSKN